MSIFFDYMEFALVMIGSSLWCFGFHIVVKKFLKQTIDFDIEHTIDWDGLHKWQQNILKPLFACPYCMASVHGTVIFFICLFGSFGLYWWPPFCICLCGLNYMINSILPEYE